MIIVDRALAKRQAESRPIRVGMVGAGFMGSGIARQILTAVAGMELVVIANRHPDRAEQAYRDAGVPDVRRVSDRASLDRALQASVPAVTDDAQLVASADGVDAVIEVTGSVEHGANVAVTAIEHGKHVVLMNAELDGTLGPLLKASADRAGVVYTGADGDQPGVQLNLYRFTKSIGVTPLVCGNIKGLQDPYRTPATQKSFAERWGQNVHMVTSFADGTKISFEQATVANATGMTIEQTGMVGRTVDGHIDEALAGYDVDRLRALGGVVDYVVGAQPAPGVYVFGTHDDPVQRHYLELYKLGKGPLYSFYTPYHLCHLEVPLSVARAVCFSDAAVAPLSGPVVDVVATAKTDLRPGDLLDGVGGFLTYGQCERAEDVHGQGLLPMGLAEGCRVVRPVARDAVLSYRDVHVPPGRLIDRLRAEQAVAFQPPAGTADVGDVIS